MIPRHRKEMYWNRLERQGLERKGSGGYGKGDVTRGEGGQHTRQAASEPCPRGWGQEPASSDQENVWLVSGERRSGCHRTEERDPQRLHKPLRWQNAAPMWGDHRQIPKPLEAPAPASREQA